MAERLERFPAQAIPQPRGDLAERRLGDDLLSRSRGQPVSMISMKQPGRADMAPTRSASIAVRRARG